MRKISLWIDRPPGPDLMQHIWFRGTDKHYYRLCDSVRWMELPEVDCAPPIRMVCAPCSDIGGSDVFHIRKRFRWNEGLLPFRKNLVHVEYPGLSVIYNESADSFAEAEDTDMLKPHLDTFLWFGSLKTEEEQRAFVEERRGSHRRQSQVKALFWNFVREFHWKTGDIHNAENALLHGIATGQPPTTWIKCRPLVQAYIDAWPQSAIYVPPPRSHHVKVASGLQVLVNPNIGARTPDGLPPHLIRLWLQPVPVTALMVGMAVYLMDRLGKGYGWDGYWRPAVLDMERRVVADGNWDADIVDHVHRTADRYVQLMESP